MPEENESQEFRLKNIYETRNYLIGEINQNELMSKKHKNVYRVLNYIEQLLVLVSTVTRCIFISFFASLVGIPIRITSSAKEWKICVRAVGIKKYKSIIKKQKRSTFSKSILIFLAKTKSNSIEVLISETLIDSFIGHDKLNK